MLGKKTKKGEEITQEGGAERFLHGYSDHARSVTTKEGSIHWVKEQNQLKKEKRRAKRKEKTPFRKKKVKRFHKNKVH